jgi:hypothetical protein
MERIEREKESGRDSLVPGFAETAENDGDDEDED